MNTQTASNKTAWLSGLKDGIPIALGYLTVSFSFGIIAKQAGLDWFQSTFMSATNVTSAGQFAGVTLIVAAATFLEMAAAQLIINSRYFLMSFALSQKIDPNTPFIHRLIMAFGITDEIFGVSAARPGRLNPFLYIRLNVRRHPRMDVGNTVGGCIRKHLAAAARQRFKHRPVRHAAGRHHSAGKRKQSVNGPDRHFDDRQLSVCRTPAPPENFIRGKNHFIDDCHCRIGRLSFSREGE